MDDNAVELVKRGDKRFGARAQLDSFRQEVALNFAPWLASWTDDIQWGEDFLSHLSDGSPVMLARDFVGQIGAMLRPPGKQWFWHRSHRDSDNDDNEIREYLDWRSMQMMRIMSDRVTGMTRACKQADEFFGLFGDNVLSIDLCRRQESLRIASWHTKDVVWAVGDENKVDTITRREKITVRVAIQRYGRSNVHKKVTEACDKDPDATIDVRHEVLPREDYDPYAKNKKFKDARYCSIWIDATNNHVMRETPQQTLRYVVSRWVTLPHMAYAISPATTIALPDARLIQQQALAIMEAAERQIAPPLIATTEAIRGDIRLDGITWVDRSYDERTGDPLRAMELGKNFQLGVENMMRTEQQLARAFYLDVLRLPDTRSSKSTLEVQQRIDEYVRAALPLFAPMQAEYNEAMLYEVDSLIALTGGYDDRAPPKRLKEADIIYAWDNPLSDMVERQKAQRVAEVAQLAQTVAALEAAAMQAPALKQIKTKKMFRQAAISVGASAWLLTEEEADEEEAEQNKQNAMQSMVASAPNVAQIIDSGVNAAEVASTIPNPSEVGFALPMPV
jgi:hypothetical protein